jgi:hypothetical protein
VARSKCRKIFIRAASIKNNYLMLSRIIARYEKYIHSLHPINI